MSESKKSVLLQILNIPGVPVGEYLLPEEVLRLERVCRVFKFPCPDIDLDETQSLKILNFLQTRPSDILHRRLGRTSIRVLSKNCYFEAILRVPFENLCLLRCLFLASPQEEFSIDPRFFAFLKTARDKGVLILTDDEDCFMEGVDSSHIKPYLNCLNKIQDLSINIATDYKCLLECVLNHFNKIQSLTIAVNDAKMFNLLQQKLKSLKTGDSRPKILVDLNNSGFFETPSAADDSAWNHLISAADTLQFSADDEISISKIQNWLNKYPEYLKKINSMHQT
jgi:hypothetical protein